MKPFTSKHCMQYLTKESPFNQSEELAEKSKPEGKVDKPKVKTIRQPQRIYKDVDGVVRDENNEDVGYPIKVTTNSEKEKK